jgi:tetratricopeptide (TPR) repeat protein
MPPRTARDARPSTSARDGAIDLTGEIDMTRPASLAGGQRDVPASTRLWPRRRPRPTPTLARLWIALVLVLLAAPPPAHAGLSSDSPRRLGASGMLEPHTGSLLVDYYETYLRDHDIDAFRQHVSGRYTEGTLARLIESPNTQARRASVLALGLTGSYDVNAAIARALRDSDPTVRSLADIARWAIWFRADSPANNATLEKVSKLTHQQQFEEAITRASRLIERAPKFAEAYNQRAIAEYFLGRFKESADDCRKVLERNPYHSGALAGLAKCQLHLDQRKAAIETLRRASKLQPFNTDLRTWIAALESGEM